MSAPRGSRKVRIVAAVLAILICTVGFTYTKDRGWRNKDYVSYWAAGQLLLQHKNPYDAKEVFRVEQAVGYRLPRPLIMRNPPWALILAVPLGLFSVSLTGLIWMLATIACWRASVVLIHRMLGSPPGKVHFLAYLLPGGLACIYTGQTSGFMLVGLTLFLYLIRWRPFLAGLALSICAMKPHLFVPFGLVLIAWTVWRRAWLVPLGTACGVGACLAVASIWDPHAMSHYLRMLRTSGLGNEIIPSASFAPRGIVFLLTHQNHIWLQMVPLVFSCAWALRYFYRNHREWDWFRHGGVLVLVSVIAAPYAWIMDEVLLLPALIAALVKVAGDRLRVAVFVALALIGDIELQRIEIASFGYMWTGVAFGIWYWWATREAVSRVRAVNWKMESPAKSAVSV